MTDPTMWFVGFPTADNDGDDGMDPDTERIVLERLAEPHRAIPAEDVMRLLDERDYTGDDVSLVELLEMFTPVEVSP